MSNVARKIVADEGNLNRERPVTKAFEFASCTGKTRSVHTETGGQVGRQGTIKETISKSGCLEKYPFFDWEPVKLFEKWSNNKFISSKYNPYGSIT